MFVGNGGQLLPICGGVLHQFLDLGVSPLCESYLDAWQLRAPETFYPLAASSVCRKSPSGATAGTRVADRDLQRICLFLGLFQLVARTCAAVCRRHDEQASNWEPPARWWSSAATTATCFDIRAKRHPGARHRPRSQRGKGCGSSQGAHPCELLRRGGRSRFGGTR